MSTHVIKTKMTTMALTAIVAPGTAVAAVPASAATARAAPTRCHTADLKAGFASGDDAKPEMGRTGKQTQAFPR